MPEALEGKLARRDAPVTRALRDAGAIIKAKANMNELAFSPGITKPEDGAASGHNVQPASIGGSPAASRSPPASHQVACPPPLASTGPSAPIGNCWPSAYPTKPSAPISLRRIWSSYFSSITVTPSQLAGGVTA